MVVSRKDKFTFSFQEFFLNKNNFIIWGYVFMRHSVKQLGMKKRRF